MPYTDDEAEDLVRVTFQTWRLQLIPLVWEFLAGITMIH